MSRLNFSWVIDGQLAASAVPKSKKDLEWLVKKQGIKSIISLNETPLSRHIKYFRDVRKELDFSHHVVSTMDGTGFFAHSFDKIVKLYRTYSKQNLPVLVHCEGGYGRTSTALIAIWIDQKKRSLDEAIEDLKRIRPQLVTTTIQMESLKKWYLSKI
ncbi:MAG: protein-tyrosine phosphatase family protein [Candidatus Hodarchaeales archaeon]